MSKILQPENHTIRNTINVFDTSHEFIDKLLGDINKDHPSMMSFIEKFESSNLAGLKCVNSVIIRKSKLQAKMQMKHCYRALLMAFKQAYLSEKRMAYVAKVSNDEMTALYEYLSGLNDIRLGQIKYLDHHELLRTPYQAYCKNHIASKNEKWINIATKTEQGIIYMHKHINVFFSYYSQAVIMRLQYILKDNIVIEMGMNKWQLQYCLKRCNFKDEKYCQVENDFSEYDAT
ncbi:hypothetical protein G9A89_020190 [Geosiphon pyriformis]|nr:hypothetical protein G9A89_020190 [Geosiphon pyriformis]